VRGLRPDGERVERFPADAFLLAKCKPVYESYLGWRQDISKAQKLADLPPEARLYIDKVGERIGLRCPSCRWGRTGRRRSAANKAGGEARRFPAEGGSLLDPVGDAGEGVEQAGGVDEAVELSGVDIEDGVARVLESMRR